MKIFIRGGTWSNIEDQVLISAFMKYGNNQWQRIASLLPRKSAPQVKARWEEYLDPTIRKTPWTQREDEKLLHLVRIMPMQWRTISQFFGRSAYQCVERYRELVDKATGTQHVEDNEYAIAHQMMPNFETMKPTPDTAELDQDEKEMLEEARARLANTQGKKARRKARERQLNVLRKTSKMRKKRELDAAGLVVEEKNMWEDEEFELDPIQTHKAKAKKFDTTEEDKQTQNDRIMRIRKKAKINREQAETLNKLQRELKLEQKKLETPIDSRRSELILPGPQIEEEELKLINQQLSQNAAYIDRISCLSLKRGITEEEQKEIESEKEKIKMKLKEIELNETVKKDLPRPIPVCKDYLDEASAEDLAEQLIAAEAFRMSLVDAKEHPQMSNTPPCLVSPANSEIESMYLEPKPVNPVALYAAELAIKEEIGDFELSDEEFTNFVNNWNRVYDELPPDELFDIGKHMSHAKRRVAKIERQIIVGSKAARSAVDVKIGEINMLSQRVFQLRRELGLFAEIAKIESETVKSRIEYQREINREIESKLRMLDSKIENKIEERKEAERISRKNSKK